MFDFQKLDVYQKARQMHKKVSLFLNVNKNVSPRLRDQLSRAALSVMLTIAEGVGRFTKADKQHYYIQSRASAFEAVACLETCYDLGLMSTAELNEFYNGYEDTSKMLFGMIQKLKQ